MAQVSNQTPRAVAPENTPTEQQHALDADEGARKLQEASEREASMEKRIADLEGELEGVRKEQEASGHKGAEASQSDKALATGESKDETARLHGELERLQAAEVQASAELARYFPDYVITDTHSTYSESHVLRELSRSGSLCG